MHLHPGHVVDWSSRICLATNALYMFFLAQAACSLPSTPLSHDQELRVLAGGVAQLASFKEAIKPNYTAQLGTSSLPWSRGRQHCEESRIK